MSTIYLWNPNPPEGGEEIYDRDETIIESEDEYIEHILPKCPICKSGHNDEDLKVCKKCQNELINN